MGWNEELLDRLATQIPCGYHPGGPTSSESTALAAIALSSANRSAAAAIQWLAACQAADGSVGTTLSRSQPSLPSQPKACWPTGWAILAALVSAGKLPAGGAGNSAFDVPRAVNWILQSAGDSAESDPVLRKSAIVGWPWVNGTYSWVEPTAIHVVALKAAGFAGHPQTREAIEMLVERLLPSGGCNYGNTVVLGQELRPHVQPTGLAMLALADQPDSDGRIARSLNYLAANLSAETTSASLSYGLIGLAAHDRYPAGAVKWLEAAYRRTIARDGAAYKLALLSLASQGTKCPLVTLNVAGTLRVPSAGCSGLPRNEGRGQETIPPYSTLMPFARPDGTRSVPAT